MEGRLHYFKAQILLETGKYFQAIQSATEACKIDPKSDSFLLVLARSQLAFGEISMAIKNFEMVVDRTSNFDLKNDALSDLKWSLQLLQQKNLILEEKKSKLSHNDFHFLSNLREGQDIFENKK